MLEILVVIGLYKTLKKKLLSKGKTAGLAWLGPAFWFGGEIGGAIIGTIIMLSQGSAEPGIAVYAFALGGAVVGAILSYVIVASQPEESYMCPTCGSDFTPSPDYAGRTTCRDCGAKLRVTGGMVYEVRKGKTD